MKNSGDKDDLLARLRTTRNALKGVYEVSSLATNIVGQTVVTAPNSPKLLGPPVYCFIALSLELHETKIILQMKSLDAAGSEMSLFEHRLLVLRQDLQSCAQQVSTHKINVHTKPIWPTSSHINVKKILRR